MLPRAEIENFLTAVFEALDLAADGLIADGYQVLLLGKQKANFEPWDAAIERYADRYGVGRA